MLVFARMLFIDHAHTLSRDIAGDLLCPDRHCQATRHFGKLSSALMKAPHSRYTELPRCSQLPEGQNDLALLGNAGQASST